MKVLMPFPGAQTTAQCFDDDTLLCQVDDVAMVCRALADAGPQSTLLVVRQWRGYEGCVALHLRRLVTEARLRGLAFYDNHGPYANAVSMLNRAQKMGRTPLPPQWIGAQWFLHSNRSALIRLYPGFYAQRFPDTPIEMPYLYPQVVPDRYDYTVAMSRLDLNMVKTGARAVPAHLLTHRRVREMYPA